MTVDSVSLGSEANSFFAEIDFSGSLSELNIWSVALSSDQMLSMTNNCENNSSYPNPDILKWSEVTESMIAGETREVDLMNLCYYSLDATVLIFPNIFCWCGTNLLFEGLNDCTLDNFNFF